MPTTVPMRVAAVAIVVAAAECPFPGAPSSAFASPKSSTLTVPSSRTFTFAGFRSR